MISSPLPESTLPDGTYKKYKIIRISRIKIIKNITPDVKKY